jgi:hypothetical protein
MKNQLLRIIYITDNKRIKKLIKKKKNLKNKKMAIENVQQLLTEQLGKMRCDIISTTAMTSRDYYCIHFPVDSVIASISASNAIAGGGSDIANLHTTMFAGTTLFLNVTDIELTSGVALCYYEQPL